MRERGRVKQREGGRERRRVRERERDRDKEEDKDRMWQWGKEKEKGKNSGLLEIWGYKSKHYETVYHKIKMRWINKVHKMRRKKDGFNCVQNNMT